MKRILLVLLVIFGLFLVGCATTKTTDVFRFEVRELKLTLSNDGENKPKELKLIRGDTDKNATIVYTVTCLEGEKAGTIDMNNGIIEVRGSGTDEHGYVTTKGIDDTVKIVPLAEGSVRFSAYILGKENIIDSIIINVGKVGMSGFSISPVYSTIYVGKTTTFKTKALPSGVDASVLKYEVSDEKIATIDANGTLKGIAVGEVTVKAYSKYDPTMYGLTKVKVSYADAGKVQCFDEDDNELDSADEIVLTKGDLFGFSTEVKAKDATLTKESVNQKVTYEVKDSSIIKVNTNEDGTTAIEALSGGTTKLTIKSADGKATFETDVVVRWAQTSSFEVENEEIALLVKKTETIKRTSVVPENANPAILVEYKSDADKDIIKIDGNKIEGLTPGTAYVIVSTIESEGNVALTKEVKIDVSYDTLASINFQTKDISIMTGSSSFADGEYKIDLKWNLDPAGSNPGVLFSSNNNEVATVDENGKVTVLDKVGTATITITSAVNPEISDTLEVKVTNKPTSFDVEGPEEDTVFVYSDTLEVKFTVTILPDDVPQDIFDVYIENYDDADVDYSIEGNVVTLIFDPDSLGEFDVEITVSGIKTTDGANSWIRSYEVVNSEE